MNQPVTPADYRGPKHFVHLHNHTVFSTLDGVATPEQYAAQCVQRGYPAMSATEHGHMGSVPDMHAAFKKAGVKFIAGCEIYFNDYEEERKQLGPGFRKLKVEDPDYYMRLARNRHLTLLAKNQVGFTNLIKLTTQAYQTGFYYKPRIWYDKLLDFKEGLIVLSGCLNGPVCHELRLLDPDGRPTPRLHSPDKRGAIDWIRRFRRDFGADYKIELQMPGIPGDVMVFRQLVTVADHLGIDLVLANDCHYLHRADFQLQKVMMAIDQGLPVDSPELFHVNSDEQYMKDRAELWARFRTGGYSAGLDDGVFERACDNTLAVAEQCQPLTIDSSPKIPTFADADRELARIVARRLHELGLDKVSKRYLIDNREVTYLDQAKLELERIIEKGYSSYFLITHDLINYGLQQGWPFSPRGSAGGSLVNFLLGISPIDPLPWGLSFDRFLSPSRGGFMQNLQMPPPLNGDSR